jgi:glycosyltransferase involved in cell wall biosynthesis
MTNRRLSVLYFSNESARGGAEQHILTLLQGLNRDRFEPILVCTPKLATLLEPDVPGDVDIIPLSLRKPTDVHAAFQLVRILRTRRIDILHSHLFYASLYASPIGWLCRVPVIIETPHVREAWRHGWKSPFVIDRLIARCVDRYIAVSHANARFLIDDKHLPAAKVTVIHNGCDLARCDAIPGETVASLKRTLGFGDEDPVLTVIGRLEPQKGHRVLLAALSIIRSVMPATRLVCVGDGTLRPALEERVHELGLRSSVQFVGFQSNVAEWLALSDIVVLPSFFEGLPLVAIEALAAGRPVVATAVDGTPEVVLNEVTGITVPPGDAPALAGALIRLLHDPGLARRLGLAGRQWVGEHFTLQRQVRTTEDLYLDLWKQRVEHPLAGLARGSDPSRRFGALLS